VMPAAFSQVEKDMARANVDRLWDCFVIRCWRLISFTLRGGGDVFTDHISGQELVGLSVAWPLIAR